MAKTIVAGFKAGVVVGVKVAPGLMLWGTVGGCTWHDDPQWAITAPEGAVLSLFSEEHEDPAHLIKLIAQFDSGFHGQCIRVDKVKTDLGRYGVSVTRL
jgi:hypothetical protein